MFWEPAAGGTAGLNGFLLTLETCRLMQVPWLDAAWCNFYPASGRGRALSRKEGVRAKRSRTSNLRNPESTAPNSGNFKSPKQHRRSRLALASEVYLRLKTRYSLPVSIICFKVEPRAVNPEFEAINPEEDSTFRSQLGSLSIG